ncbi:MAG: hypothetical protein Q4Q03_01625 [Bowdeniella nasicola]|nr:hypothetical protein [Bowdeniella nasicola]
MFTDDDEKDPPLRSYLGRDTDLASRLSEEEPEVSGARDIPYDRAEGAVGQLVAEPDDDGPEDEVGEEQSIFATASGKPRRDAAPEESAMFLQQANDQTEWFDDDDLDSGDEDDDETPRRDDSAAEFAFDEEEEDELA